MIVKAAFFSFIVFLSSPTDAATITPEELKVLETKCSKGCLIFTPKDVEELETKITNRVKSAYEAGENTCKRSKMI